MTRKIGPFHLDLNKYIVKQKCPTCGRMSEVLYGRRCPECSKAGLGEALQAALEERAAVDVKSFTRDD